MCPWLFAQISECSHQGKSNPNCGFIAFSSGPSAPLGLGLEDHFFEFGADVDMYQLGNRPLSVISSFRNLWVGRAIESRTNIRTSVCIPPCHCAQVFQRCVPHTCVPMTCTQRMHRETVRGMFYHAYTNYMEVRLDMRVE